MRWKVGKTRLEKRLGLMADENDPFCTVLLLLGQVSESIRVPKGEVAGRIDGLSYPPGTGPIQAHNGLPGRRGWDRNEVVP